MIECLTQDQRVVGSHCHVSLKLHSLQLRTFFEIFYFLFKSFVKVELSYVFTINLFTIAETARKSELSYKTGVFFSCL